MTDPIAVPECTADMQVPDSLSAADRAAQDRARALAAAKATAAARQKHRVPRAINEDDDGYDPYSDYMDARSSYSEPPCADPWR